MDEKFWRTVKDTFLAALEKDEGERARFLDDACSGDPALRKEVESLLASHNELDDFIEQAPIPVAGIFPDEPDSRGQHFGNYKIIRQIGAGGMGAVFLAERVDGEFSQQVAIKIIRQSIAETETLNRFKRERQILASLDHPNIARLLDGGVSSTGEPFLAMEYVEGKPLIEYSADLNITDKLKLFLKICSAVSFAHRSLVIHRDLKPSNILVTAEGEPKLLDFGLAKILDLEMDATQTATAFRALTPAYASPEQLAGNEVTTASDVYSLAIVLYEMLTGSRPYDLQGKSLEQIIRTLSETKPFLPSEARGSVTDLRPLKGDLDNILLFALRTEPERRYATVEQLAEDIRRHLELKPVNARPSTLRYQAGRFVRRNRAVTIVAALLLLTLTAGVAATVWQARAATRERERAENRFNDVRKLSSSLLFEISPQIERLPGSTKARETIVRRALEYLDSLAAESADNEALQSELASAYEQVGDVQGKPGRSNLGDLKGATESYQKAQRIRLALAERYPDNADLQRLLASNYHSMGELLWWSSAIDDALTNYRLALGIYEGLAARAPNDAELTFRLIRTNMGIATALSFNSKREQSVVIYRQAIERLERLKADHSDMIELHRLLENAHIHLGYDLSWLDDMDEAAKEVDIAIGIGEPLLAANPNDAEVRRALWLTYFLSAGIFEDAAPDRSRRYLDRSIDIAKQAIATDPTDFQAKHDLAQSLSKLSVVAVTEKKFAEAIDLLKSSESLLAELSTAEPRHSGYKLNRANNLIRLGDAQAGSGDMQNALQSYEQARAFNQNLWENDPTDNMPIRNLAIIGQKTGQVYEKLREYKQAAEHLKKGLEMFAVLRDKGILEEYDRSVVTDTEQSLERCLGKVGG